MGNPEDRLKHQRRRKNHIAKDLRTKKYDQRIIQPYDRYKIKIVIEDDIEDLEVEMEYYDE